MSLPQSETYYYFSMCRKSDNKEVYTSRYYLKEFYNSLADNIIDWPKVGKTLKYYFDRVNSGIQQQMDSLRVPEDQKKNLKFLDPIDYKVFLKEGKPIGYLEPILNEYEANEIISKI